MKKDENNRAKFFENLLWNNKDKHINKMKKPSLVGAEEYNNIVGEKKITLKNNISSFLFFNLKIILFKAKTIIKICKMTNTQK